MAALCSQPYILPGQPQAHSFEAFQASLHKACWHIKHQTGKAVAAWLTGGPSAITTTNGSSPSGPAQKPHSTWPPCGMIRCGHSQMHAVNG